MPKDFSRPPLPATSFDFSLPQCSSFASTSALTTEDSQAILQRFRRPTLLAPKLGFLSDTRLNSPLAASFTLESSPKRRRHDDESGTQSIDGSPSSRSGNTTPPVVTDEDDEPIPRMQKSAKSPTRRHFYNADGLEIRAPYPKRRLSFPLKPPRIANILAEERPLENEVKSEAAFQRLVASGAELPMQPRVHRVSSDRGRYPEEARNEDSDTDSDDDEPEEDAHSNYTSSEPINVARNTPASQDNVSGDDSTTTTTTGSPSISQLSMDVDVPSPSPSLSSISSITMSQWRYTPPPATSVVRSNKRKFDDRYDPYANASKRRAVSPSLNLLRDPHSAMNSPIRGSVPRLPIAIPIAIPASNVNSATSSPTFSSSYPMTLGRPMSMTSSPTLRATMGLGLSSPILRPIPRRRLDYEDREIEGAGDGVGSLSLG